MIAILIGRILNSRKVENSEVWFHALKLTLERHGSQFKEWDIYNGDVFQLKIEEPQYALGIAFELKNSLKKLGLIDASIAIEIGEFENIHARSKEEIIALFTNSNSWMNEYGQQIAVKTPWLSFDIGMNLILRLSLIIINGWSVGATQLIHELMTNRHLLQEEVGEKFGIKQSAVSQKLARANFKDIVETVNYFESQVEQRISNNQIQ